MTDRLHLPMWMVGTGLAVAFGAGYLAGDVGSARPAPAGPAAVEQAGRVGTMSAPPLTEEQLQGTLPAGHPGFTPTAPGAGTADPTPTPPGTQPAAPVPTQPAAPVPTQPAAATSRPGATSVP